CARPTQTLGHRCTDQQPLEHRWRQLEQDAPPVLHQLQLQAGLVSNQLADHHGELECAVGAAVGRAIWRRVRQNFQTRQAADQWQRHRVLERGKARHRPGVDASSPGRDSAAEATARTLEENGGGQEQEDSDVKTPKVIEAKQTVDAKQTVEARRLTEAREQQVPWRKWGPYLSERQWGTVREDYSEKGDAWDYFTHEQARSRAYHWGEDGLAGISDDKQRLCFALALWNEKDPILKERLFGLTNSEGNHGEDVKEYYFYIDSTPTHS